MQVRKQELVANRSVSVGIKQFKRLTRDSGLNEVSCVAVMSWRSVRKLQCTPYLSAPKDFSNDSCVEHWEYRVLCTRSTL